MSVRTESRLPLYAIPITVALNSQVATVRTVPLGPDMNWAGTKKDCCRRARKGIIGMKARGSSVGKKT